MAAKIRRNAQVAATDGELGEVRHVIVDPETREVTHVVVGHDLGEQLLPYTEVSAVDGDQVALRGTLHDYANAERFHRDEYRAVDDEQGKQESAHAATHGGAPLLGAG